MSSIIFSCRLKMVFPRINDFKNKRSNTKNSLLKDISLFSKTRGPQYGGSSLGSHLKTSSKKQSVYYLAKHSLLEYFACEVLLAISINTPKIRIIAQPQGDQNYLMASQAIENYIPIRVFRTDVGNSLPTELQILRDTYELDIENQIIINKIDGTIYKISGNLFTLDLAALFLSDTDLQPKENNIGLIKEGSRFYVVTIDKDCTAFKGSNYYQLHGRLDDDILEDKLFKAQTSEQSLFLINAIAECLTLDTDGKCNFDKIFENPRVSNTPYLNESSTTYCNNIKKSATSIINHYKKTLGDNILFQFVEREKIRVLLADNVIQQLELKGMPFDAAKIKNVLIEDLRAPYYAASFHEPLISMSDVNENPQLMQRLIDDLTNELNLKSGYSFDLNKNLSEESMEQAPSYNFYY